MAFKDLFIVSESQAQKPVASVNEAAQKPVIAQTAFVTSSNSAIVKQLWQQIINRNLPGPDYLELRNTIDALSDLPLSEQQKVEAGFKMLVKSNPTLTKQVILDSIDQYIGIVEEEKQAGLKECETQRQQKIISKKEEKTRLSSELSRIDSEIAALQAQQQQVSVSLSKIDEEIATAETSIKQQESEFLASIETVKNTLLNDKAQYQTYNL